MAEVDFGDSELFEQLHDSTPAIPKHIRFTDDDEEQDEASQLRLRLEECEEHNQRLNEENQVLRRKLNVLTRPSGITVGDVNIDGPLLQVLYTNNSISKQCRQEIEDCICGLIVKHRKPGHGQKNSSFRVKPQHSAFALEECPEKQSHSNVQTTTEAFKVVGSVLYFTTFSVDKLGQPLLNENPQLTDGWDVPIYNQVFNQVIGTDGQEVEMKDKRPKSMCFNCGSSSHQMRDCPKPKDMAAINERRKEFNQSNQSVSGNQRYHADEVEERFAKYKPGVLSEELLAALGIDGNTLPPLIYRMRQLGYPPGWLKEAEMENSGLSLYDGNAPNDDSSNSQNITYDVSKLVDFPGFNVPAPHKMKDEFMHYGSIPMQSSHQKQNYAAYLSNFQMSGANSNKRRQESDSSPQQRKKIKCSPDQTSDMDVESDPGTPYNDRRGDFQFQPPLPPGSPCFSTPPPLPQGTPPATPTPPPLPRGTPPLTPKNGSPAPQSGNWTVVDETTEETADDLSLEELEEQQRLIWAALENADTATNTDSDTPAVGTPAPSSSSVSTPAHVDTESEEAEEAMDTVTPAEPCDGQEIQEETEIQEPCDGQEIQEETEIQEPCDGQEIQEETEIQEVSSQSAEPVKVEEDSPQSPEPVKPQEDSSQNPALIRSHYDTPQSPDSIKNVEDSPQSPDADSAQPGGEDADPPDGEAKVTAVPHRSKFAAGIVPFEDTPEFTEVAEATGTYLRIRDLLKSSPRSLSRKK
ncbi:zinc finger CCHC domain-containing protein 8 isoform X2 [Salarias fasciatus]|uniref:zinc finger CCHC domain-containing protein 8 isoform X2 n=1 Tax=Salarias fasciatus TaxID=181472 RepID=UPI00117678F0|nr:zinc finger CCHC domain-containing protein 8 isoform X2 [Salarias fasciatus]